MADEGEIPQGQGAYRRLLDEIRDGALLPGARLRETDLADRLGISRTPVREAIRQLEASKEGRAPKVDLVISDIRMPDFNGLEVFSAAKRLGNAPPVILMTGFGYDPHHSIVRASQEGLQDVLYKPFQVEQLVELVRKALKFGGRDGITAAS